MSVYGFVTGAGEEVIGGYFNEKAMLSSRAKTEKRAQMQLVREAACAGLGSSSDKGDEGRR